MHAEEEITKAIDQYADMVKKYVLLMKQQCDVDDIFKLFLY